MKSGLLSDSEKLFLRNLNRSKNKKKTEEKQPLQIRSKPKKKSEKKQILEIQIDDLKRDIWKKEDKITELEETIFQQKYEIRNLESEIDYLKEDFRKKMILQFAHTAKHILSECKLNQKEVNSLIKLSKKFEIENRQRSQIIRQLIEKKRRGKL